MSAREEILGSVRRALAAAPDTEPPVSRAYRDVPAPTTDLVGLFCERVAEYRARVTRCRATDVPTRLRAALEGTSGVIVPKGFEYPVPGAVPDVGQSPAELDRVDAVVTNASVGIAATGTIVLEHGSAQGRRAVSLVPDLHVCLVREEQVVAGVPEAVALLDPNRPQTWVSGPSATSDIELDRVEGVHGPRNLHVFLVEA